MYLARPLGGSRLTSGAIRPGGMFRLRPRVHMQFFDRNIIKTRWPRFNRDPLMHAGNLVMRIARQSIRRRKGPSPPGSPPHRHARTPDTRYGRARYSKRGRRIGRTDPFQQIFSLPYRFGTSVIVGMVGYTRTAVPVPGLQEEGGIARRKVFTNLGQQRKKSGQWGKQRRKYGAKMVRYPKRAFMQPALMRARQRLPRLWFNSLGHSRM